jgi:adhesin transport system membrane fusion protein
MKFPTLRVLPIMSLSLVAFLAWASYFEIEQTVRTQGQVIPGARTQLIQAVDGGVLSDIRVQEGDPVKRGQIVAVLETDRARAAFAESESKVAAMSAALERSQAEAQGRTPVFGKAFAGHANLVAAQNALYAQRKQGLRESVSAMEESLTMASEELRINEKLMGTGDISQVELLRARRQVLELKAKILELHHKYQQEARTEAARLEDELSAQRFRMDERRNVLNHTELTASMDGVVKFLRFNTVGGVLRAGDELMQISPTESELLLEIKINPADVGQLHMGLPAQIRLDAFDYTIYGSTYGELVYLGSDTLTEQGPNGQPQTSYRGRIRLTPEKLPAHLKLRDVAVKPGMTATADIQVGRRTILQYLTKPIARAFGGAMTER